MRAGNVPTAVCVLLAAYTGAAAAQNEDFFDLSLDDLSKLKVTAASAFAETSLDSSASVSVVQRQDWELRGARNLPDAVLHLPGVMLLQPAAGGQLIQVRSYDSTSLRGRATLVDGVPINTFAFGSEVFSNAELQLPVLNNLELVRGPSSILYGSDAFHSALLMSTYRSSKPELTVAGTAGSDRYRQVSLRATQPVGERQLLQTAVAVAHQGDQRQPYDYLALDGTLATAHRAQEYDAATALLRWQGQTHRVAHALQLFVDKNDSEQIAGGGSAFGDTRNFDVADHNAELWLLKGQLDGNLGAGWDWRWDAYYWRNDYGQSFSLPKLDEPAGTFYEDTQQFVEHRYGSNFRIANTNLQTLGGRTQLALTAGAEEAGIDDHDNRRRRIGGGSIAQPPLDYSGLDQSVASISAEGKTRWQDGRLQLVYGGRFDEYSTFGGQTSPRFGAIWMPARDYSVKALYGSAFRAPNANELLGTNFVSGSANLKPETLDNYEITFATIQGRWRVELVGFESQWHDRIILTADPTALNGRRYANIGESRAAGAELTFDYVADRWRIELNGSRISNRNLDTGMHSSVFPEWIVNFGAGYRWPAQRLELFVDNRLHQNVKVGDQALSAQPLEDAGTFFRTDLSLRQQWRGEWSGRLSVRNLFDRANTWPTPLNNRGGYADIGRQLVIEISYQPQF